MKKVVSLLLIISALASCAQKKQSHNKESNMIPYPKEFENITAENYVSSIISKMKKYDKHVKYFIRPVQTNCIFEVLINDIPIYKEYSLDKTASPIEINSEILKSGLQTITVRMYPIGDAIKDAYGKGETISTLQRNSNVSIKVVKYDAFNISDELDDEIIVMQHNSPTNNKTDEFLGDGLPFYEYTFTFDANVPYHLRAHYTEGEDLKKINIDTLKIQVLKYYENLKTIFENKNADLFAKLSIGDNIRLAQADFNNEQYIKDSWEWFESMIKISDKNFFDLEEGVQMQFFGNGKLVSLKHPTLNPIDKRLRGKPALGFLHEEDGRRKAKFIGVFLYLPKGATLDQLQMMR